MTQQLRYWVDYDRSELPKLTPSERIDYFEKRVKLVAVNPLQRLLDYEIHVSPDSSALLIYGVSICAVIEATGKFATGGRGGNASRFDAFLCGYMSRDFQLQTFVGKSYGKILWTYFRNGLAHGFTVRHGGFEGNRGESYFRIRRVAGKDILMVNPFLLYDDFVSGFERYLGSLHAAPTGGPLFRDFNRVFQDVFIKGK